MEEEKLLKIIRFLKHAHCDGWMGRLFSMDGALAAFRQERSSRHLRKKISSSFVMPATKPTNHLSSSFSASDDAFRLWRKFLSFEYLDKHAHPFYHGKTKRRRREDILAPKTRKCLSTQVPFFCSLAGRLTFACLLWPDRRTDATVLQSWSEK